MYNVLIVDDDTLMRNALRAMISRFKNFQIIGEAANGAEAIAICRLYPVHLIFMDIIMPGMTGIEAGKKIKEDSPQTEICILSAYSDFHFAKEAMELHIKKYFSKPVSFLDISTYLENFSPSTYKNVCPQLSQALELANSQSFSETYAGLSSIINEIFSSQNASIESLKKTFIEIGQGLLDSLEYANQRNEITDLFPLPDTWLVNGEIMKIWLFKIMDYIYQQKSIRRYSILEGVFFFIEQHIKEKISLGQITEGSMISQGYLSRIFRDQFGISTMEYIRLRKIQMVKINFIFTTHNTSDVAFMLGFNESSYLQKVFQKIEGISIQEFKKRLK